MSDSFIARKSKGLREFWQLFLFAIVILTLVTILYGFEPFSDFWNNFLSNFVMVFAAGLSAALATRVFMRYAPSDSPRNVWMQFALGLWLWTLAEVVWGYYILRQVEVDLTIADLFWVSAYGLFGYAVQIQYQIVFHPGKRENIFWVAVWTGVAFSLTFFIAWLLVRFTSETWGLSLLVAAFYPAADIAVGLSALRIVMRFRGGALGYPWLGLFVFAIADMLYAVLQFSGAYSWSAVADTVYIAAYLFVALGCYAQLLLLRYGPIFTTIRKDNKRTK